MNFVTSGVTILQGGNVHKGLGLLTVVLFFSSLGWASSNPSTHGCSIFDRYGDLVGEYRLLFNYQQDRVTSIEIETRLFWSEALIYNKTNKTLIGSEVKLPVPAFPVFDQWKNSCVESAMMSCDQVAYDNEKMRHERSSQWIIYPHEISENDPTYEVVYSKVTSVDKVKGPLSEVGMAGQYRVYESPQEVDLQHILLANDKYSQNQPFVNLPMISRIKLLDNPRSYSLTIDRKASKQESYLREVSLNVVCDK